MKIDLEKKKPNKLKYRNKYILYTYILETQSDLLHMF